MRTRRVCSAGDMLDWGRVESDGGCVIGRGLAERNMHDGEWQEVTANVTGRYVFTGCRYWRHCYESMYFFLKVGEKIESMVARARRHLLHLWST